MSPVEAPASRFVLRDGTAAGARPVHAGDRPAVERFLRALSPDSRCMRFLSPSVDHGHAAALLTEVDGLDRYGLIAVAEPGDDVIGHAGYWRTTGRRAEVAVVVADTFHRRGLGTCLLVRLAAEAAERGIDVLFAEALPENTAIVRCVLRSFPSAWIRHRAGLVWLEFPTRAEAPRTPVLVA